MVSMRTCYVLCIPIGGAEYSCFSMDRALSCYLRFAVAITAITLFSTPACCSLQNVTQTQVYVAEEGGYFCFRIPALLFTSKGSLLAFAEGRGQHTRVCSDHGDVHIVVKRSPDLGKTWSNLTIVYQESGYTIGT